METNLKRICEAIPVSTAGDISTQASAIMEGITGEQVTFDIVVGTSPTCLPPELTYPSLNTVSWKNKMPAEYNANMTAVFRDQAVASPFQIPADCRDESLTITVSAANFQSYTLTVNLNYVESSYLIAWNDAVYSGGYWNPGVTVCQRRCDPTGAGETSLSVPNLTAGDQYYTDYLVRLSYEWSYSSKYNSMTVVVTSNGQTVSKTRSRSDGAFELTFLPGEFGLEPRIVPASCLVSVTLS